MKTDSSEQLLADVDAYCRELRPIEELCYLEHRYNEQTVLLAKKYNLLGMPVPVEYGGRGADSLTYARALRGSAARGPAYGRSSPARLRSGNTRSCATAMPSSASATCRHRAGAKRSWPSA